MCKRREMYTIHGQSEQGVPFLSFVDHIHFFDFDTVGCLFIFFLVLILLLAFTLLTFPLIAVLLKVTLLVTMIEFYIVLGLGLALTLIFVLAFSPFS